MVVEVMEEERVEVAALAVVAVRVVPVEVRTML
jgi:hypothetical protein